MEKYRYKKKQEYSHFCFCLGLRPGVIISSILWILEGSVFALIFIKSSMTTYKVNKEDVVGDEITSIYYYTNALTVVLSFYFVIFTGISILGLITLIAQKSILFMRLYSYTSWFFAVFIYSVLAIVANIAMITNRNFFINYCEEMTNAPASYCVKKVNLQLLLLAIIIFFQGSLHIYFSIILRVYVKRFIYTRTKRSRPAKSSKRAIIDPLDDDRSLTPSPTHSVLNIKVGRTFDARTSYEV